MMMFGFLSLLLEVLNKFLLMHLLDLTQLFNFIQLSFICRF